MRQKWANTRKPRASKATLKITARGVKTLHLFGKPLCAGNFSKNNVS